MSATIFLLVLQSIWLCTHCYEWQLISILRNVKDGTFSSSIKDNGIQNKNNGAYQNTWSIIGDIGDIIQSSPELYTDSNGKFAFVLWYDYQDWTSDRLVWWQSSWIEDSAPVAGYQPYSVPQESNSLAAHQYFKGLSKSSSSATYLDGDDNYSGSTGEWWNSVGTIGTHTSGIPAFNGKIAYSYSLYIKRLSTAAPTPSPTRTPTPSPTPSPTLYPTPSPTSYPTLAPTSSPTLAPTLTPTSAPTAYPKISRVSTIWYGGNNGTYGSAIIYNGIKQDKISNISWGLSSVCDDMDGMITAFKWNGYGNQNGLGSCVPWSIDPFLCDSIKLAQDEYINGYRVYYNESIHGIHFQSSYNKIYECGPSLSHVTNSKDTGWISYNNYYLSGFEWRADAVLNAIRFQFTAINDSYNCISSNINAPINLAKGTKIYSPNRIIQMTINNDDGHLCLYNQYNYPLWCVASEVNGYDPKWSNAYSVFEYNGNVVYKTASDIIWSTNTVTNATPASLCVIDCGVAVLLDKNKTELWRTQSIGDTCTPSPTAQPTNHPSMEPTMEPTLYPTIHPTIYPTVYPTIYPSYHPTDRPTLPKIFPLQNTTDTVIENTVSVETTGNRFEYNANHDEFKLTPTLIITAVAVSLLMIILVLSILFYVHLHPKKKQNDQDGNNDNGDDIASKKEDENFNNIVGKALPPSPKLTIISVKSMEDIDESQTQTEGMYGEGNNKQMETNGRNNYNVQGVEMMKT